MVAVAALPVMLPAIGFVTVKPVSVPTLVIAGCAAVVTVPAVVAVAALPVHEPDDPLALPVRLPVTLPVICPVTPSVPAIVALPVTAISPATT